MTKLKLGELFAGYGGLGLAVEEVFDAELAWYAEFDKAPSKIMAHHWPDITNYGDVTTVDWANIPPVDIISGGSPCQDLSLAGARKGMSDGTRSNLWESMREAIATIKPTYVVWENVRGALSAKATSASDMGQREGFLGERGGYLRALGRVLGDLSDLGYDTQWRGLRAADVGAPHGRFRVFVLATRRGSQLADTDDSGLEGQRDSDGTTPTERHRHLGPCIDAGHSIAQDADRTASGERREPASGQAESGRARAGASGRSGAPTANANDREPNIEEGADGAGHCGAEQGRAELWAGGRTSPTRRGVDWGVYAPAIRRWEAVRGTAPAPTELTAKGKHRLSARFAEWMMGVEPGWVTNVDISRNEQLKAIGNGVVPQQAVAALRHMLGANHAS